MNLRSGTVLRSGQVEGSVARSKASTQESTARTSSYATHQVPNLESDSQSESSMSSGNPRIEMEFNAILNYVKDNTYGAKIYRDLLKRSVVKIKDHISEFDATPIVSYQETHYMGRDGVMYQIVDDPEIDVMGQRMSPRQHYGDEAPPRPYDPDFSLVNSLPVKRVKIDDLSKDIYSCKDKETGAMCYYVRDRILGPWSG